MMETSPIQEEAAALGAVPLVWAAATADQSHLNLGDALSPVMVALLSGLPVVHAGHNAKRTRMAAVGTIGQMLQNGDVTVWGTGASRYSNPHVVPRSDRMPFTPYPGTRYRIAATRGPVSRALFAQEETGAPAAYGDPVWLLPQFYRPQIEKKWELGVIAHLSDLSGSDLDAPVRPELLRYQLPEEFRDSVRIIRTRTAISAAALRERLDEILACRRIVSASLHGMVFAESYGIPCLYFSPRGTQRGLVRQHLSPDNGQDLRITDLYQGLGLKELPVYVQSRRARTNWAHLMKSIDRFWEPKAFDYEPLLSAFPLEMAPLHPLPGQSVFEHPLIRDLPFQHTSYTRANMVAKTAPQGLKRLVRRLMKRDADEAAADTSSETSGLH
ncbi:MULTISPECIES: polysaccharide pyruvyl transferase family protein [unclassified Xanthobacter]|uniref:polysaccharide pyruvyl transferase family protein n=1 Tax=unclassified Xanthobacter TaxID=2623496 RepID=UPI001F3FB5A2|nr:MULTISPECIES: polysaccharide pyruvyl transferase family protein [unclassified Xanthobacter]